LAQEERLDHQEILAAMATILFLVPLHQPVVVVALPLQTQQEVLVVRVAAELGLVAQAEQPLHQGKAMRVALARLQVAQTFLPLVVEAAQPEQERQHPMELVEMAAMEQPIL
jgi:hypothetical protein